jgi:hypothetical protein
MTHFTKKSLFISETIRRLTHTEACFYSAAQTIVHLDIEEVTIGYIPTYFSDDQKLRPLILHKDVVHKIQKKHGKINVENLLINAHDWEIGVRNMDYVSGKINLIKRIPNSDNFLLISAWRENGYYILTHFETETLQGNELKSLLGRGDSFSRDA